ncbi:MAG: glycoside hydrolase family 9 protein, partial [Planctomycetota bacterium]
HPDWDSLGGDPWDHKDWSAYVEPGSPVNPDAWGGHSDAMDWDRRAQQISIVWDLALPVLLTGRAGGDDLGIPDSGNGIPDLLDTARYEADFWLRLRDGRGDYSMGVNNPSEDHSVAYQAKAEPWMAWANAASAGVLAESFRRVGHKELTASYTAAAIEAWERADGRDLDVRFNIGLGRASGRDLKALAAACLVHLTGEDRYHDAFVQACVVTTPTTPLESPYEYAQHWAVAAYLAGFEHGGAAPRDESLWERLMQAVRHEAETKHLEPFRRAASRRATDPDHAWFQSVIKTHALMTAHALAGDGQARDEMAGALHAEADWSLGRNPLNRVLMTGPDAATGLGERVPHLGYIYTTGRNDGTPGSHPGHTPYMNPEPWGGQPFKGDPKGWYGSRGYPVWERWPFGEALWNARYSYANNEFTPQQTMSGKTAHYAYLVLMDP